jgi:hypothetical protein
MTETLHPGKASIPKLDVTWLLACAAHSLQPHPQQFGHRAPLTPQTPAHPGAHYPNHDSEPAEQLASCVGQNHGVLYTHTLWDAGKHIYTLCGMQENTFCSLTKLFLVELTGHEVGRHL